MIGRVEAKLNGRDFGNGKTVLDVPEQVENLIRQATSHVNLCQCYIGWSEQHITIMNHQAPTHGIAILKGTSLNMC